ncbi:type III secretion system chaperone family protein [Vibrio mangrovi]|uniref:Tir chaperone protein (CesT) n=1 Tax=Vibrio mangrovi TaxID=474394 RepID=A0A1Y6ITH1_9VIBR|nr:hypothetical protein [Vibrio mangrovi]MDW6004638.1 hypothetical protein [Vibrio mangrovi]SMS00928.1 hypothetical protein VIM7927_02201 [Vibrio mangrovi]
MDPFIQTLFLDVFKKMEIDVPAGMTEFRLVVDEEHPIFLRYDARTERIMILGMLDIDERTDKTTLYRRLLNAGLNPLLGQEPGVGIDEKSGCCFSYLTLSRQAVNAELVCHEIGRLVEWGKRILVA